MEIIDTLHDEHGIEITDELYDDTLTLLTGIEDHMQIAGTWVINSPDNIVIELSTLTENERTLRRFKEDVTHMIEQLDSYTISETDTITNDFGEWRTTITIQLQE